MFTGIIEGVGSVSQVEKKKEGVCLFIRAPFSLRRDKLGDSLAVDGCCLTLIQKKGNVFCVEVSPETLSRTTLGALKKNSPVNLERALKLGDRLGGHWVQGHVDGIGKLRSKENKKDWIFLEIDFSPRLRKYMVEKGSVTVDGVSLTINRVSAKTFSLCLIPHTQKLTALTAKKVGDRVNLEVDILAKYVLQGC